MGEGGLMLDIRYGFVTKAKLYKTKEDLVHQICISLHNLSVPYKVNGDTIDLLRTDKKENRSKNLKVLYYVMEHVNQLEMPSNSTDNVYKVVLSLNKMKIEVTQIIKEV